MNTLMDILHVLAAVFIVGPMAILPMTGMRAVRAGDGRQVSALATSTFVFTLLSLLTVIFGFGVMGTSNPKYNLSVSTPWIMISLVLYVIAFILSLAVVWPTLRRAGRRLKEQHGGADAAGVAPTGAASTGLAGNEYTIIAMGSGIVTILLLVVVILMVWKP